MNIKIVEAIMRGEPIKVKVNGDPKSAESVLSVISGFKGAHQLTANKLGLCVTNTREGLMRIDLDIGTIPPELREPLIERLSNTHGETCTIEIDGYPKPVRPTKPA